MTIRNDLLVGAALALMITAQIALAHPICLDSTAPYQRTNAAFAKCPQYNTLPTCFAPSQEASKVVDPVFASPDTVPGPCSTMLHNISCAILDQWSGHLFRAEGPGDYLPAPKICTDYCAELYKACQVTSMSHSPFVGGSTTPTTMQAVYGSPTAFCDALAADTYCFNGVPYTVPPAKAFTANFNLCHERVIEGGQPIANMQPVPGYPDHMMLGDLAGLIKIYAVNNTQTGTPFVEVTTLIDIRDKVAYGGERGLLGVAMHKGFKTNGRFYVSFSCRGARARIGCNTGDTIIDEYRVPNPGGPPASLKARLSTRRRIFRTFQPYPNHNGGQVLFSPDPADPHLYLMLGDGGSGGDPDNRAQPLNKPHGKIHRFDVDSTFKRKGPGVAPKDNPYTKTPGAIPTIWTNGMRNPWRCSFDRDTYVMYCGDVGQDTMEEVDIITKGGNYGWSRFEGTLDYNEDRLLKGNPVVTPPILTYTHDDMGGYASITGGYVIRTNRDARTAGKYIFSDLSGPKFLANEDPPGSGQWAKSQVGVDCSTESVIDCVQPGSIYSFGEMASGDILYGDGDGNVFRLVEPSKCV